MVYAMPLQRPVPAAAVALQVVGLGRRNAAVKHSQWATDRWGGVPYLCTANIMFSQHLEDAAEQSPVHTRRLSLEDLLTKGAEGLLATASGALLESLTSNLFVVRGKPESRLPSCTVSRCPDQALNCLSLSTA